MIVAAELIVKAHKLSAPARVSLVMTRYVLDRLRYLSCMYLVIYYTGSFNVYKTAF